MAAEVATATGAWAALAAAAAEEGVDVGACEAMALPLAVSPSAGGAAAAVAANEEDDLDAAAIDEDSAAAAAPSLYAAAASASARRRADGGGAAAAATRPTKETGLAFTVTIKFDAEAYAQGQNDEFIADLFEYGERYDADPVVEVMVLLPPAFPIEPPSVRMLWPMLVHGTGGVVAGCFTSIPALFLEGWNPSFTLAMMISWIRDSFRVHRARVNLDSNAHYNIRAFEAARRRLMVVRPPRDIAHPQAFQKTMYLYSSSFALEVMAATVPTDFEAGNKVLLHSSILEQLVRSELPSIGGVGRAGGGLQRAETFAGEEAMIFELTSHLGFPAYCGVRQFTSPEPDVVVVPMEMFASMGVPEGTEVRLRRVRLPPLTTAVFEPHTTNFYASETFAGLPPKEYLEASLHRYSCLQAGEVILCDGGNAEPGATPGFRFTVVAVQPHGAPAAALWTQGYSTTVGIEFLPAADAYETRHPRRGGAARRAGGVGIWNEEVQRQLDAEHGFAPLSPGAAAAPGVGAPTPFIGTGDVAPPPSGWGALAARGEGFVLGGAGAAAGRAAGTRSQIGAERRAAPGPVPPSAAAATAARWLAPGDAATSASAQLRPPTAHGGVDWRLGTAPSPTREVLHGGGVAAPLPYGEMVPGGHEAAAHSTDSAAAFQLSSHRWASALAPAASAPGPVPARAAAAVEPSGDFAPSLQGFNRSSTAAQVPTAETGNDGTDLDIFPAPVHAPVARSLPGPASFRPAFNLSPDVPSSAAAAGAAASRSPPVAASEFSTGTSQQVQPLPQRAIISTGGEVVPAAAAAAAGPPLVDISSGHATAAAPAPAPASAAEREARRRAIAEAALRRLQQQQQQQHQESADATPP